MKHLDNAFLPEKKFFIKFCINSGNDCIGRYNGRFADENLHAGKFLQWNWKSLPI